MASRKTQEAIIKSYPSDYIEHALDAVKRRKGGFLQLLTDDAVYELAIVLGHQRRRRNRMNAENHIATAAYRKQLQMAGE